VAGDACDRDAQVIARVAKHLCRRMRMLRPNVGEHDVLRDTDTPRNGLTD